MQEIFIEVGFDLVKGFAHYFACAKKKGVKLRKKQLKGLESITFGFF